jgi:lysyl-tRNA synthetase class 2
MENKVWNIRGRIKSFRIMGKSCFANINCQGEDGYLHSIQIYAKQGITENFESFLTLKIGDILEVLEGEWFITHTQEKTIRVLKFRLNISSVISMPFPKSTDDKVFNEITDKETRYRQRYIDLQVNPDTYKIFVDRSNFIQTIRDYFVSNGFMEVETPILQPVYGGASAEPFVTHHNSLNQDMYLRIAPELYLKRLLVGGFEKVFEIGKNFRNEGLSRFHNPEFTMMEAYWAYADYSDMMVFMRMLFIDLTGRFLGTSLFPDKVLQYSSLVPDTIPLEEKDNYFKEHVQSTLIEPCFVTNYPRELVPLAKAHPVPGLAQKFQFYWKGIEIANAYTEQNDYEEQKKMFSSQVGIKYPLDNDFLEALKYGMPSATGIGIGIDRFFMAMFDIESIKEVILFPQLKDNK